MVIREYADSPKVPSALFKQGEAYQQMGDTKQATTVLCELIEQARQDPRGAPGAGQEYPLPLDRRIGQANANGGPETGRRWRLWTGRIAGLGGKAHRQFVHLLSEHLLAGDLPLDLLARVDHGGVVLAAEAVADVGKGGLDDLPAQVHGHLAGQHDGLVPPAGAQVVHAHPEKVRHRFLDGGDRRQPLLLGAQLLQDVLGELRG